MSDARMTGCMHRTDIVVAGRLQDSPRIRIEISLGEDRHTTVTGATLQEALAKIPDFHTMGAFEREHYTKKGTLGEELASGWWLA